MRGVVWMRAMIGGLVMLSSFAVAAVSDPQQMVRETGDRVLAEVTARKAELEARPELIYPLVESTVLPHFDFREMSQSALGRFWRDASEDQKAGITREFRELLVRTYASALLGYSGQQIEYLPAQIPADATNVMIPTRITSAGAPPVPINYRLKLEDSKWMVYDVVIDGVSLITNYRSQFAAVVRRNGIDGLIATLADKNRQVGK
ncbi:MAG: ABC transporter substrate-binding protein [Chromatiaceae bacterium]|nr:ABC transporter substrate-binding protein [Chromatiaceae bacterium]MCP5440521.1 ABC transporter substrate-binding protein [Chromatiaceae bacterium]HPE79814.1 ABC transporter substrate-binding protein [Gammaproteobacteria bacterium]